MRIKIVLLAAIVCGLVSCLSMKYNKWVGKNQTELIRQYGPPDRTASDGGSGKVLVYYDKTTTTARYDPTRLGGENYLETSQPSVNFFVDQSGRIYSWNVRK